MKKAFLALVKAAIVLFCRANSLLRVMILVTCVSIDGSTRGL